MIVRRIRDEYSKKVGAAGSGSNGATCSGTTALPSGQMTIGDSRLPFDAELLVHRVPHNADPTVRSLRPRDDPEGATRKADCSVHVLDSASETVEVSLHELRELVTDHLPWVDRETLEPVGMWVSDAGYLDEPHVVFPSRETHPPGTAYVAVAVSCWEAADALRDALATIARLDEHSWEFDWEPSETAFRAIRVFPDPLLIH